MRRLLSYLVAMAAILLGSYILYQFRDLDMRTVVAPSKLEHTIQSAVLSNGMELIVVPNHRVPAVSHTIWLRLGGADDPIGKSGLAHYLEHLMFKGTPSVPSGEYSKIIERLGGNHNAFTGHDFTGYYVNIAKEHLETVMKLEADRFQNLTIPESEYKKERAVIIEERKSRTDNNPSAQLSEKLSAVQFQHHPYRIPIIGWMHEIEQLNAKDAKAFYDRFYHPGNMVLVLSGDVTMEEAMPLAEQYYGVMQAKEAYKRQWVKEPPHITERQVVLHHEQVKQPRWTRRYMAPSAVNGDTQHAMPLLLLSQWLGGGKTSLIYQELVVKQQIAISAATSYSSLSYGPSRFSVHVTPPPGVSMQQVQQAVDAIIEQAVSDRVSESDLSRIKTLLKADVIYARDGLASIAHFVGYLRMLGLDTSYYTQWTEQIDLVSGDAIQQAAQAVFAGKGVTGYLLPETQDIAVKAVPAIEPENATEEVSDDSQD